MWSDVREALLLVRDCWQLVPNALRLLSIVMLSLVSFVCLASFFRS